MSVLMVLMVGIYVGKALSQNGCVDISIRDLSKVSSGERPIHSMLNTTVSSLAECAVNCFNLGNCAAFFYHQTLLKCILNSEQVSQVNLTLETGWIGYNLPANGTFADAAIVSNETSATWSMAETTAATSATTTRPSFSSSAPKITRSTLTTVTSTATLAFPITTTSATISVTSGNETTAISTTTSLTTSDTTTFPTSTTTSPTATTSVTATTSTAPTVTTTTRPIISETVTSTAASTTTTTATTVSTLPTTSAAAETTVISTTTYSTTTSTTTTTPASTTTSPTATTAITTTMTAATTTAISNNATTPTTTTTPTGVTTTPARISLWVDSVVHFSSQYRSARWSAEQIVGTPDVYPAYGDDPSAWASAEWTGVEWIEVQFSQLLFITKVDIYETFHAGGVKKVSARNPSTSTWDVLWQVSTVSVITSSRIFSPSIQQPTYKTDQLRIEVDCGPANDWVELDAVKVTGHA